MLADGHRLRHSAEFSVAVRQGRRCARGRVVVHLAVEPSRAGSSAPVLPAGPARAGFVVSKAVGGAVVRNTVTRRLRALVRTRLDRLPAGSMLVVRALPAAALASSAELAVDLDACLDACLDRVLGDAPAPERAGAPTSAVQR